jgi:hypothetical protein
MPEVVLDSGRIDKETNGVEFIVVIIVIVLTPRLEPKADATDFEVAPLPIDDDDGDTKNTFPPHLAPAPATHRDKQCCHERAVDAVSQNW